MQAVNRAGEVVARTRTVVPSSGQAVWMLRPGTDTGLDEGSVLVVNVRPEPVRIRVNGFDRGEVRPNGRRLVPALTPGVHVVEALGVRTGEVLRADVTVQPGRTTSWEARPSVSVLAVRNLRDEPVRLLMDGNEIAFLAPAEEAEVRVPSGQHLLEARGATTLRASLHNIVLSPSVRVALDIPSPFASVTVTNHLPDPLDVRADERGLGVIGPGERVTFRDLGPGTIRLNARSLTRPLEWTTTVHLEAGQEYDWDLSQ